MITFTFLKELSLLQNNSKYSGNFITSYKDFGMQYCRNLLSIPLSSTVLNLLFKKMG